MAETHLSAIPPGESSIEDASIFPQPDFAKLPLTFVLATNLSEAELHEIEDTLVKRGAPLTFDIKEAHLVIGNISKERRAKFELKRGKVLLEDDDNNLEPDKLSPGSSEQVLDPVQVKRRKLGNETRVVHEDVTTVDTEINCKAGNAMMDIHPSERHYVARSISQLSEATLESVDTDLPISKIKVVKLEWLHETLATGRVQSFEPFTIYEARLLSSKENRSSSALNVSQSLLETGKPIETSKAKGTLPHDIIERAKADIKPSVKSRSFSRARNRDHAKEAASRDFTGRIFMPSAKVANQSPLRVTKRPPSLVHQTTSEHDADFEGESLPVPDWVKEHKIYSCERATPFENPNEEFISQLKKIKLARVLTGDEIGVRAYSTSIASLAAYPYPLVSARDILTLPGCDQKISQLFHEWHTSGGHIEAVAEIDADPTLKVLSLFYEIWGVGASTAREFYYDRHWRDLDDIIEHGWKSLTRVQQIGVKYYDEFQLKMSRAQVEAIAATVQSHARRLTDDRLETIIVGGYRRGKLESGDADIILTHPSEPVTRDLITPVVASLESAGYITHTLTLALTNSNRNQQPLPLRTSSAHGHGFDTLDKALVVWQDPPSPSPSPASSSSSHPLSPNPIPNPNPHRRVDIIISPWRTIGCAVEGWTSGTTFQRDLRRYAKKRKGWKFDSSGVRDRATGRWVDLERWTDPRTRCTDWRDAEKRVFEGLGLVFREPGERCTG